MIRGSDHKVRLTLTDTNGTAFDIDQLTGCIVEFSQKNFEIQKFSLNPLAGHTDIVVEDAPNGVIVCTVLGENTINAFVDKEVYYSVKIEYADTDFPDDITMIDSGNICMRSTMRDSFNKTVNTFA